MNLISTLVGISVAGASMPMMMQMSIAPFEAQKRAGNLGLAETSAVTYAAFNEGNTSLTAAPEGCYVTSIDSAHVITCTEGEGTRFVQTVTRAFRTDPGGTDADNPDGPSDRTDASDVRTFDYVTPDGFSHVECLSSDPWGVQWYNKHLAAGNMKACIPSPLWNLNRYLASDPDDWLYDISSYGLGQHPDF
jgi:hypothetical protein